MKKHYLINEDLLTILVAEQLRSKALTNYFVEGESMDKQAFEWCAELHIAKTTKWYPIAQAFIKEKYADLEVKGE